MVSNLASGTCRSQFRSPEHLSPAVERRQMHWRVLTSVTHWLGIQVPRLPARQAHPDWPRTALRCRPDPESQQLKAISTETGTWLPAAAAACKGLVKNT